MRFFFSLITASLARMIIACVMAQVFCMSLAVLSHAQGKFTLTPDSVYITDGAGTEFDLSLDVDAGVIGLKLYQIMFAFDKTRLDTVSITEGPLMATSGSPTAPFFQALFNDDSTVLTVQSLILGNGYNVDGPGNLATIRLKVLDTGLVHFSVVSLEANGDGNNPLVPFPTATGAELLINLPPTSFNLVDPIDASSFLLVDGDLINFDWSNSESIYAGSGIEYTLQYSTTPTFTAPTTTEITGLTSSDYSLNVTGLLSDDYYWRVVAIDDNGFERLSGQTYSFHLDLNIAPTQVSLIEPSNGAMLIRQPGTDIDFYWHPSTTLYSSNPITYTLEYATEPTFMPLNTITAIGIPDTMYTISVDVLTFSQDYFWRVTANDSHGLNSTSSFIRTFTPSMGTCCDKAGDADDNDKVNIGDVTFLIAYIFSSGPTPPCMDKGDANGSNSINIGDVTHLIAYIFSSGPDPICGSTGL